MRLIGFLLLLIHLVACSKGGDKSQSSQSSSIISISSASQSNSTITSSSSNSVSSNSNSSAPAYSLDSYDWGQTIVTSNTKLIPNKSALLRLHIVNNQPTPVPDIQVQAILNNGTTQLTVTKPAQLPSTINVNATDQSYRVIVDKALMRSGLRIKVTIAGAEETITPIFGIENKLYITLVPIKITKPVTGEIATGVVPNLQTIKNGFLQLWPFSEVNLQTRAIYTSAAEKADDMEGVLPEIAELRELDGERSHYYGFFSDDIYSLFDFDGFGGIAYLSSTAGIGSDRDPGLSIMLHEVGHNFSLNHINCGDTTKPVVYDNLYPHDTNSIGTLGVNASFSMFYQPTSYRDIMSYCSPEFVSDYSYKKAQNYLEQNPSRIFRSTTLQKTAASTEPSWFISGQILADNSVKLRRLIPITRESILQEDGQYQLIITDPLGNRHTQFFNTQELDHANQNSARFFSLYIPYTEINKLEIYQADNLLFSQIESSTQSSTPSTVQLQKTATDTPLVSYDNNHVCLNWKNKDYDSASLILTQDEDQSTVFMDTTSNPYCVDFLIPTGAKEWRILLRKGLSVDQYRQNIDVL
jgi:Peptidase M66